MLQILVFLYLFAVFSPLFSPAIEDNSAVSGRFRSPKEFLDSHDVLTTAFDDDIAFDAIAGLPGEFAMSAEPDFVEFEPTVRFEDDSRLVDVETNRTRRSVRLKKGRKRKKIINRGGSHHGVGEVDYGKTVSKVINNIIQTKSYDKRIRPNYKGNPVDIGLSLFIAGVSSVSEVNMDVTLDFYFRQFWQDPRLDFHKDWEEEIVVGGEFMREIWRPDTFFVNAKQAFFHKVTMLNTFLRITSTGNVKQSLRLTVTASCPMNFRYFPMDSQRCSLEIESFGYTTRDITYQWSKARASVEFSPEVQLPQFIVRGHREITRHIVLSTGNYSRLAVEIYFERSLGYYLIQVYVPASLIVMLSLVSFWINRESAPARVTLGITTVLTMTTLISSTNASLPKISYLKAIDVYLVSCFVMVFAALLEYAAVTYTGKRCKMLQLKTHKFTKPNGLAKVANVQNGSGLHLLDPGAAKHGTFLTNRKIGSGHDYHDSETPALLASVDLDQSHHFVVSHMSRQESDGDDLDGGISTNSGGDSNSKCRCCDYCSYIDAKASDIEKYSRIVFPTVFACFNILYWITYLNISVVTDEEGFIPAKTH